VPSPQFQINASNAATDDPPVTLATPVVELTAVTDAPSHAVEGDAMMERYEYFGAALADVALAAERQSVVQTQSGSAKRGRRKEVSMEWNLPNHADFRRLKAHRLKIIFPYSAGVLIAGTTTVAGDSFASSNTASASRLSP
jgi:hypothetical protein